MILVTLIIAIASLILLGRMVHLSHRAAVAAETTAVIISTFYANMTPEAKEKGEEYLRGFK